MARGKTWVAYLYNVIVNDNKLLHRRALARVKIRHFLFNLVHHFANLSVPVLVFLALISNPPLVLELFAPKIITIVMNGIYTNYNR